MQPTPNPARQPMPLDVAMRGSYRRLQPMALATVGILLGLLIVRLLTDVRGWWLSGMAFGSCAMFGYAIWQEIAFLKRLPGHPDDQPGPSPAELHRFRRGVIRLGVFLLLFVIPLYVTGGLLLFGDHTLQLRLTGVGLAVLGVAASAAGLNLLAASTRKPVYLDDEDDA